MILIRHELRQGRRALILWSASIGLLLAVCVFLFPEMKGEMDTVTQLFSSLGGFSAAFGMDRLNFGTLIGFYAVECGNILGLGGAFYAALCAVSMLAKEERDRTAEFLLSHPISRSRVVTEKLAAVGLQLLLLNLLLLVIPAASIAAIGEPLPWREMLLLHLAYFLLQCEIAAICFGISSYIRRGGPGIGLGLAAILYFLQLLANLSSQAEFLSYLTPFGYADSARIVNTLRLDIGRLALGIIYAAVGLAAAYIHYGRKDIQ